MMPSVCKVSWQIACSLARLPIFRNRKCISYLYIYQVYEIDEIGRDFRSGVINLINLINFINPKGYIENTFSPSFKNSFSAASSLGCISSNSRNRSWKLWLPLMMATRALRTNSISP